MRPVPVALVAALLILSSPTLFGQAPAGGVPIARPGTTTGTQAPGMPSRDSRGPQAGTARLRGRVVSAQSGMPIRRAQIIAIAIEGQLRRVATTDSEGRYELVELPAGRILLTASKAGHVTLQYGQRQRSEAGTPVTLADGESVERVDFSLPSSSVITVRVTDDFGEPLAGAQIQVQQFQYGRDGQRRLTTAPGGVMFPSATDDRGEFRAYGLAPGEYVVNASVRNTGIAAPTNPNDANDGFSPTYYPGTSNAAEAQAISLGGGEERSVQFAMVSSRLARITGTVFNSEGRPAAGAQLMVVTRHGSGWSSDGGGTVAADGTFAIAGIAPGEYSIDVRPQIVPGGSAGGEFTSLPITVSGADITGLRIVTSKSATVSGRVVFEGSAPRNSPTMTTPLRVIALPVDPTNRPVFLGGDPLSNGVLDDRGNFELSVTSGTVFFAVTTPPLWTMKSVTLDGRNITDEPLELTGRQSVTGLVIRLTDKLTQVSGRVSDGRGQLLRDYVIVIQPAEATEPLLNARSIRIVRPDTSGRFDMRGMRPGRYAATAIEAIDQGRQFAPEFQQQLRRTAKEFSLREGETVALDLTLTPDL